VTDASLAIGARDVRVGGRWTPGQRIKNDALFLAARAALAAAGLLSPSFRRSAGRALGALAYALAGPARRMALANAARAFPEWTEHDRAAMVRRSFRALGGWLGESAGALGGSAVTAPIPVTDGARAVLDEARSHGRGVVFASAHLGPWERVAGAIVAAGFPLVTIARESYDPRFSRLFEAMRARAGVGVIWRGSRTAPWKIVRSLRSGAVLGVPMDLRARVESRDVHFLGHPAPTPIGPARIALRTRTPVVVGSAAPGENGSLVVTASHIWSHDLDDDDCGAIELTARINAEIARRIRAFPHAWVWMHDRWRSEAAL
jgi:KDO2-lipid IV(A) lauroyltransferase